VQLYPGGDENAGDGMTFSSPSRTSQTRPLKLILVLVSMMVWNGSGRRTIRRST
jgi:hypothetical protein